MFIKEVLNYDDFIITDGEYDLRCCYFDFNLDLPEKLQPKKGRRVASIIAFAPDGIEAKRFDKKTYSIKKGKNPLNYTLCGKVVDNKKALVRVGGFAIEIEADELPSSLLNEEFIEFKVSRLDCFLGI